jgi:hypothetical protein
LIGKLFSMNINNTLNVAWTPFGLDVSDVGHALILILI